LLVVAEWAPLMELCRSLKEVSQVDELLVEVKLASVVAPKDALEASF
jgi:hypothetical protein